MLLLLAARAGSPRASCIVQLQRAYTESVQKATPLLRALCFVPQDYQYLRPQSRKPKAGKIPAFQVEGQNEYCHDFWIPSLTSLTRISENEQSERSTTSPLGQPGQQDETVREHTIRSTVETHHTPSVNETNLTSFLLFYSPSFAYSSASHPH